MQGFPVFIILLLIWVFIVPLMKVARKQTESQQKTRPAAPQNAPQQETPAAPRPEGAPTYSRLTPTISVTEHDDSVYQGSLNAVTGEGYDPCHDEQLAPLSTAEKTTVPPAVQDHTQLPFGWTGNDVVRGIVMSEILNRKKRAS